jgi:hypothetical protein
MSEFLTGDRFEVEVQLDKKRLLRIDFNALCRAEQVSGISFLSFEGELTGVRLKAITWASLVYEPGERQFTYDEVGDLLNAHIFDVIGAITVAWAKSMTLPEEAGEYEDPQETAPAPS